ncbi:MAG: Calx-beta domain-containing protein, partial [Geitlerinemataceae cyanobacterium]
MANIAFWDFNDNDLTVDGGDQINGEVAVAVGLTDASRDGYSQFKDWSTLPAIDVATADTDYLEFQVNLANYNNIGFQFKERQNAGPQNFSLAYRVGDVGNFTLLGSGTTNEGDLVEQTFNATNAPGMAALNDAGLTAFRLFGYNQAGNQNWRIDDVFITGDILPSKFSIAATDADKAEGNDPNATTPFTFTITRTADLSQPATVSYSIAGSGANAATTTSPDDFSPGTATVGFAAGQDTQDITIGVVGDTTAEPDEEFTVTLDATTFGTIVGATATGTILNDDKAISIAATDAAKLEGNEGATTNFTFTLTRTGDLAAETSVDYTVSGGAADAADFGGTFPTDTATFAPNAETVDIIIPVTGDLDPEAAEDFIVTLSNPTGGELLIVPTATGTIQGDDNAFEIVTDSASQFEGNGGTTPFTFT